MHRVSLVVILMALMLCTTEAWAQAPASPPGSAPANNPFAMWDVQKMVDRASSQLVRRYTLTPEQEDFTRKLMTSRVNAFLDKHEQEIREIFAEAVRYQLSGNPPPAEKVKEWTARIDPMFAEAKSQILQGNQEFREILSDDQRAIHDVDLKVMEQNFRDADKRIANMREGTLDLDFSKKPKPNSGAQAAAPAAQPAAPAPQAAAEPAPAAPSHVPPPPPAATPPAPGRTVGPSAASVDRSSDYWEMYVRKFVDNYNLDGAQSQQANQILADTKKQAAEYMTSHKADYERLQTQLAEKGGDKAAATEVAQQLSELNKPVQVDMFNELKARLDRIPTDAQRKAFEESQPKKTAKAPATQRSVASRPAGSRPVATRPAAGSRPLVQRLTTTRPAGNGAVAAPPTAQH